MNGKERRSHNYFMRRAFQFWRIKFRLSGVSTKRNSKLILFQSIRKWKHLILAKRHYYYLLKLKSFNGWKERVYHILHTRDYIKNKQTSIIRLLQIYKRKYHEVLNQAFQHWCELYGPEFQRRKQRQVLEDIGIYKLYLFIYFFILFYYIFIIFLIYRLEI